MKLTLLEIRKKKNLKQKPILELMQIDRKTLYRWEHCETAPDHWQLRKLCQFYNVHPDSVKIAARYDPYSFLPWSTTFAEYEADRIRRNKEFFNSVRNMYRETYGIPEKGKKDIFGIVEE